MSFKTMIMRTHTHTHGHANGCFAIFFLLLCTCWLLNMCVCQYIKNMMDVCHINLHHVASII